MSESSNPAAGRPGGSRSYGDAQTAVRLGQTASMLLPVEVLWRRTAYLLQPPGGISNNFVSPFSDRVMDCQGVLSALVTSSGRKG